MGIVSMDGSIIEDVHYQDITLTRTSPRRSTSRSAQRRRCPRQPGRRPDQQHHVSPTSTGTNLSHPARRGRRRRVQQHDHRYDRGAGRERHTHQRPADACPGGHPASEATPGAGRVPRPPTRRATTASGRRTASGCATSATSRSTTARVRVRQQRRPAGVHRRRRRRTSSNQRFTAERGSASPYDVGVSRITGYAVRDSARTPAAPRCGSSADRRIHPAAAAPPNPPPPPPPPGTGSRRRTPRSRRAPWRPSTPASAAPGTSTSTTWRAARSSGRCTPRRGGHRDADVRLRQRHHREPADGHHRQRRCSSPTTSTSRAPGRGRSYQTRSVTVPLVAGDQHDPAPA